MIALYQVERYIYRSTWYRLYLFGVNVLVFGKSYDVLRAHVCA